MSTISGIIVSLTVADGNAALDFYQRAFDAEIELRMESPDGGVMHAEFKLGSVTIMLSEAAEEYQAAPIPPGTLSSNLLSLGVSDCDAITEQARQAGAKVLREPADEEWGARASVIADPFGYRWGLVQEFDSKDAEAVIEDAKQILAETGGH